VPYIVVSRLKIREKIIISYYSVLNQLGTKRDQVRTDNLFCISK